MRPELSLNQNCPKCGRRRVAPYQCKDESCWQCWDCGKIWYPKALDKNKVISLNKKLSERINKD